MRILISNSSNDPIYIQIVKQLKILIINDELNPASPLPSIRNLAQELGISVITTKKAYDVLESEGYIETVPGKGSFVSSQNKEFIREKRLKILEDKVNEVIDDSVLLNISCEQLKEMLDILYNEKIKEDKK